VSDEISLRAWLEAYLTPLVPGTWRIIPSLTLPKTIEQPTVTITHTRMAPEPAAPMSRNVVNDLVIRIANPLEDLLRAENDLDDDVNTLIHALKTSDRLRWTDAEKVQIKETPYFGWDVTVQVLSTLKPQETE